MSTRPCYDGIWVGDRYWNEPEDYIDWCFDEDVTPDTSVEICRIRPFEMDASEIVERAYEVNEVDQGDDNAAPDIHAITELQRALDEWSRKHLNNWAFPTGEMLDIRDLIEEHRRDEASEPKGETN